MRTFIVILILLVLAAIAAVASGIVDIRQTGSAELPDVSVSDEGVAAKGGRQPTFDVETGSVAVGAETKSVTVPTLQVEGAEDRAARRSADGQQNEPADITDEVEPMAPAGS